MLTQNGIISKKKRRRRDGSTVRKGANFDKLTAALNIIDSFISVSTLLCFIAIRFYSQNVLQILAKNVMNVKAILLQ